MTIKHDSECGMRPGDSWVSGPRSDEALLSDLENPDREHHHSGKGTDWTVHGTDSPHNPKQKNEEKKLGDAIYGLFPDDESDAVKEVREIRRNI